MTSSSGLRRWLGLWLLFSALGGVWALASPVFSIPDEPAHAIYSAAAVRGELWEEGEGLRTPVEVPAEYADAGDIPTCYAFQPEAPAGCSGAFDDESGSAEVFSSAGRYPPVYYLYAGLGSLVAGGAEAVYLMRALTVVAVGALLASAACSVLDQRRRGYTLLGLALAMTPMLFFFAGSVNPQAPEIAAAILLWVSGAALLHALNVDPDIRLRLPTPLVRRVLVAVLVLTVVRPLSLFWLALIVTCLVVAFGSIPALRGLLASTGVRIGVGLAALSAGITLFWILARDSLLQQDVPIFADTSLPRAVLISVGKLDTEYQEMIGVFGWRDTLSPGVAYVLFSLLLGALLVIATTRASRRQLLTVAGLAGAVLVLPPVLELREYQSSAFAWQGRYTLPIAVGVPLLLGFLADVRAGRTREDGFRSGALQDARRVPVLFAGALVIIHVAGFVGALNRNMHGVSGFWFVDPPGWVPPAPDVVLIGAHAAVCVALAVLLVRAAHDDLATDPMTEEARRPAEHEPLVAAGRGASRAPVPGGANEQSPSLGPG
jgi:hypothetical protein